MVSPGGAEPGSFAPARRRFRSAPPGPEVSLPRAGTSCRRHHTRKFRAAARALPAGAGYTSAEGTRNRYVLADVLGGQKADKLRTSDHGKYLYSTLLHSFERA